MNDYIGTLADLDRSADEDKEEVCGGEARQECVGRGLQGRLLHHSQDDQQVAQHSEGKGQSEQVMLLYIVIIVSSHILPKEVGNKLSDSRKTKPSPS